jgi:hypothetical protein
MSTSFCVGYFSTSATEGQFCQASLSLSRGAVASAGTMEDESPDRLRGLGGSRASASVEWEPVAAVPRPFLMQTPAVRPGYLDGTLPGVMAGKRPAARLVGSI